jgi:hypothetical protein
MIILDGKEGLMPVFSAHLVFPNRDRSIKRMIQILQEAKVG